MRITEIETFPVPPRWLFVKVSTDAGLAGWGEATFEGRSEVAAAKSHRWRGPIWRHKDNSFAEW
jgi:L-alanine-DL-glutamate epimerase-like enolase superfamily enzyme